MMSSKPDTSQSQRSFISFRTHSTLSAREEEVDWKSLEEKFEELRSYLSAPTLSFSNSVEERKKQRENIELGLEAIIEVALSESTIMFQDGNLQNSFKGALKTLSFVQQLYGTNAIEQIDIYFLLAKITQAQRKYKQSEEFLSIAQWTIIKNPKCSNQLRAELHQNFGLLYVQKKKLQKSIHHLSTSVYYLCLLYGTNHITTSFGYFNMGNVFASLGKKKASNEFLDKVLKIWYNQLKITLNNSKVDDKKKVTSQLNKLEDEKISDANRMFEQILNVVIEEFTENSLQTAYVFKVLGLYQWFVGESAKAKECLEKASSIMKYCLGDNHKDITEVDNMIKLVSQKDEMIVS